MIQLALALEDEINRARIEADESHKIAMNSYGAGYDTGYRDGLSKALQLYRDGLSKALQLCHDAELFYRED